MGFYDEMQETASGILSEFKQGSILLIKPGAETGDPWKPTIAAGTSTALDGSASGPAHKYVTGGIAVQGDVQVTCAVPAVTPEITDSVSIDGKLFKIVHVAAIPAAGTPVVYNLICRAG